MPRNLPDELFGGVRQRVTARRLPIGVTDIRPGFVDTDMAKGEGLFWVAPVDKACRQIARGIDRRRKSYMLPGAGGWLLGCIVIYRGGCMSG